MAKAKQEQWNRLALWQGSGKKPYVIAERNSNGELGCSCWPWRKNRTCKHLDQIKVAVLSESSLPSRCFVLQPEALKIAVARAAEEQGTPEEVLPGLAEYEAEMGVAS